MAVKRTEVTNELLYETLKAIQSTLARHSDDLREIKERAAAPDPVASQSPIAESAFPTRSHLLHSRIFAWAQAIATGSRVDVHPAAEFKWHQAPNPAGVVWSGVVANPDRKPRR